MSAVRYINIAKDLIENRAEKYSANNKITPEYFDNLYSEIKSSIQNIAKNFFQFVNYYIVIILLNFR